LADAAVVFQNRLGFEPWFDHHCERAGRDALAPAATRAPGCRSA
jgi:hypothetical protein